MRTEDSLRRDPAVEDGPAAADRAMAGDEGDDMATPLASTSSAQLFSPPVMGVGRKASVSLQLFRETTSDADQNGEVSVPTNDVKGKGRATASSPSAPEPTRAQSGTFTLRTFTSQASPAKPYSSLTLSRPVSPAASSPSRRSSPSITRESSQDQHPSDLMLPPAASATASAPPALGSTPRRKSTRRHPSSDTYDALHGSAPPVPSPLHAGSPANRQPHVPATPASITASLPQIEADLSPSMPIRRKRCVSVAPITHARSFKVVSTARPSSPRMASAVQSIEAMLLDDALDGHHSPMKPRQLVYEPAHESALASSASEASFDGHETDVASWRGQTDASDFEFDDDEDDSPPTDQEWQHVTGIDANDDPEKQRWSDDEGDEDLDEDGKAYDYQLDVGAMPLPSKLAGHQRAAPETNVDGGLLHHRAQLSPSLPADDSLRPTVPLEPFKNQVGGHSSIYRFSRRAVCKVRPFSRGTIDAHSHSSSERTSSTKLSSANRPICCSSCRSTWAS